MPLAMLMVAVCFFAPSANASSSGISGYSGKTAGRICTSCHSSGPGVTASLSGPTSVASGSTNTYTVTITGPGTKGGIDVASTAGTFAAGTGSKVQSGELVHSSPSTTKIWTFSFIAPTVTSNTTATMYAAGVDQYSGGTGTTTMAITVTPSTALPALKLSATSLSFNYSTGGTAPAAQTFSVSSSGAALTYTVAASGGTWLSATGGGTTPGNVSVSVNPAGLAAGTYTGTVSVAATGSSNSPQNVAVTLTVATPPNLSVTPTALAFTYTVGSVTPPAQTFAVNSSGAALTYSVAASGGSWLSASSGGTTPSNVSVSVNPAGLTAGTYSGSVSVTATGAANSPQTVSVTLTITASTLSVSPSSLSFVYTLGGSTPATQTLAVSSSGGAALSYNVAASGGTWLSATGSGTTPGTVSVSVNPSGLTAGTYTGSLSITATGASNSPQSIGVTLTVTSNPALVLSPTSLSFSYVIGDTAPAAQPITVSSSGSALSYTVSTSGGAWLSASGGGLTPGTVSVSINTSGLAAGTYSGTITITATGAANSPQTVAATLTVTSPPSLAVSPSSLTFSYTSGGSAPAAQTFAVSSSGTALNYSVATTGGAWLTATGTGTTPGTVTVSVNTSGLAAGTYTGAVNVTAMGAANSPLSVAVMLTVTVPTPTLLLSPTTLSFAYTTGGTIPPAQMVSVSSSSTALVYTVTSGSTWITAVGGGTTPGNLSVSVDPTAFAAGTYTGIVSVASSAAANTPQNLEITLTVTTATPPTVSINSPQPNSVVAGVINLTATASAGAGIAGVSYEVDNNQIGIEQGTAPYTVTWDTTGVPNGIHNITVNARDALGNTATSTSSFQVSNGSMPSGGFLGAMLDSSTKFQVQPNTASSLISCPTCWFATASDLLPGQVVEVRLRAGSSPTTADVVILKLQTIDGSIMQVGTNQFTLQPSATYLPTSVTVILGSSTNMNGVTPQVGQSVSVRGILFNKVSASGGPTLAATIVELQ
ncbi:MAG: hypothetical protein JO065_03915 [Acidobacteria bacterium]|nr:hypothetical protein [Acidobacteriota bacterium]